MTISKLILFINFIIVLIYAVFLYMRYTAENYLPTDELIFTGIICPFIISLTIIIHSEICNHKLSSYLFWILEIILFSNILSYTNWGIDSGDLLNPDFKTFQITQMTFIISLIICFGCILLYSLIRWLVKKIKI